MHQSKFQRKNRREGTPNTPKYQTCEVCRSQAKGTEKGRSIAKYICKHGHTFILSIERKR